MTKQDVLDLIEPLAEEVDPETLMDRLYLRAKLERAEAAVAAGKVLSHDDVVKRSETWFE